MENIRNQVVSLLGADSSGHGMDHIDRVVRLSLTFAGKEKANPEITGLLALLHDVDDHKLFGEESAKALPHAREILKTTELSAQAQEEILEELACIGYSNALNGIRPKTLEGMIVSDADMCDALGANGILRTYAYGQKHGRPFFNRSIFPTPTVTAQSYNASQGGEQNSVCHFFEKILRLKNLMMTQAGAEEARSRHAIVVEFLYHLFSEENAPEWTAYLNEYLG